MNENVKKPLQVIKASAGSGKTYELTLEYIKLLLGEKNVETGEFYLKPRTEYHQHILAVTFTNKATDEMKGRIVKELSRLSKGESEIKDKLVALLHTSEEKLKEAAQTALEEILFNYTTFNVSTIDSFFQTIMRTFAYELDQDYDYAVELDNNYSVTVAIQNMLRDAGGKGTGNVLVQKWLSDYMRHLLESEAAWNIFSGNIFESISGVLGKEVYQSNSEEIEKYLADVLSDKGNKVATRIDRFKKRLKESLNANDDKKEILKKRFLDALKDAGIKGIAELSPKSGLAPVKNALLGIVAKDWKKLESFESSAEKWKTADDKEWKKRAKNGEFDASAREIDEVAHETFILYKERSLLNDSLKNIYLFGLLGVIGSELNKFLRDNDTVLLSGTNQLLKNVVCEGNVMFMYERLGTWINHYLIDEFQDTSMMQYDNLRPLIEESVSSANEDLVIGDEKQCIYRFRSSDPTLLQSTIIDDFKDDVHVDNTKEINWRSADNVIAFNNEVIQQFVDILGAGETYSNLKQKPNPKNHGNQGMVKLSIIEERDSTSKFGDIVLDRLPSVINEIRSRGYSPKDIAILVNTNSEGGSVVDALLQHNLNVTDEAERIDVVSAEAMFLRKSPAVRLVISNLRYFDTLNITDSSNDAVNAAREREEKIRRVLSQYDKQASELADCDDPEKQSRAMGDLLKQCFEVDAKRQRKTPVPDGKEHLSKEYVSMRDELLLSKADAFDLISIVENVICKVVTPEVRESEKAYLLAFMDSVIDYCANHTATVHAFLKWWDVNKNLSINSPSGRDAVNVLTIHKSKGLEFPCVIIPFAKWDMSRVDNQIWIDRDCFLQHEAFKDYDKEIVPPILPVNSAAMDGGDCKAWQDVYDEEYGKGVIDNLNKTYVAFTRAVNEMHLFVPKEKDLDNGNVTLSKLIVAVVEDDLLTQSAGEFENEEVYSLGDLQQKYEQNQSSVAEPQEFYGMPSEVPEYDSVSRKMLVSLPEVFNATQKRGIKMHTLFSMLRYVRQRDRVLRIARRRGIIRDCYDYAVALVDKVLADPKTAKWFADDNIVVNERTIIRGGGKKNLRPDRVVRTAEGKLVVIDYKFGNDHSKDDKYKQQVKGYVNELQQMGFAVDEGYVWYPESGEVISVL